MLRLSKIGSVHSTILAAAMKNLDEYFLSLVASK